MTEPTDPRLAEVLHLQEVARSRFHAIASANFAADHGWVDPPTEADLEGLRQAERDLKAALHRLRREAPEVLRSWCEEEIARATHPDQIARWREVMSGATDDPILGVLST